MNLKSFFLLPAFLCLFILPAKATKVRVNNTLSAPDQVDFNQLGAAIMAASAGDTIYVEGSPIAYEGGVILDRPITIIGPGYLLENNPNVCNHLNATIGGGPGLIINSGADGSFITGLNFTSSFSLAGIRIDQNSDPISNITITRNRIYSINFSTGTNASFVFIDRNMICEDIGFFASTNINNLHITNNLIIGDINDFGSLIDISNSSIRNNTFKANSTIWIEGSVISYNYVGKIESEPNNISINNNILGKVNDPDNDFIKSVTPSNICDPYEDDSWGCNDDNWLFAFSDETDTHGAYNGANSYPVPFANLPALPIIEACSVQTCGDSTIQVQFVIRNYN